MNRRLFEDLVAQAQMFAAENTQNSEQKSTEEKEDAR